MGFPSYIVAFLEVPTLNPLSQNLNCMVRADSMQIWGKKTSNQTKNKSVQVLIGNCWLSNG